MVFLGLQRPQICLRMAGTVNISQLANIDKSTLMMIIALSGQRHENNLKNGEPVSGDEWSQTGFLFRQSNSTDFPEPFVRNFFKGVIVRQ